MPPDNVNNKSQKMQARVPHEIAENVEATKEDGESTAQYIITALKGEIKRRQRKKARPEPES
ncbi:YlcI/YnfO family protein [Hafnia sp. HMSC23F03]|uniref:YlcI/YnfO family protein n=1 Tax=Hafnia sp. HMSC23F03 TaxID=1581059 RepID=UPI0009F7196D|nr:YlcI/YnfO family protein [Hafnia sp. HMSC23F03]